VTGRKLIAEDIAVAEARILYPATIVPILIYFPGLSENGLGDRST
jgi:hypothetical protein